MHSKEFSGGLFVDPSSQDISTSSSENDAQISQRKSKLTSGRAIVGYLAALSLILHLATAGVYGLFIDELYFLACGQHLAWGYVDMPPVTAFQAWLTRALFGDSMLSIRLFPALAGAGLVWLTGALVRELGGKRFAQTLAALAVFFAPVYLAFDSYLSMNSLEPLFWMGCAFLLLRIIKTGNTKLWLWFGVLAGLGLENKLTMGLFGMALVIGLLLTAERRWMWNRWLVGGGVIAFLIFLPNLIWMIQHHFPMLELLANIRRDGRDVRFSPLQFMTMQILLLGPLSLPLWMAGLWRFLVTRVGKAFRSLGWAYGFSLLVLLLLHGKVYYLAPAYPMLLAAGAVSFEGWLERPRVRWWRPAYVAVLVLVGALCAPTVMPILPPATYFRYMQALHLSQPRLENRAASAMPQFFADRFGWPEMAQAVAKVYFSLNPQERAKTAIFGNDYGESGAIDFYGPKLGLPKSIGNHLNYWYWGPRHYTGEIMIVLGDTRQGVERHFDSVEAVGEVGHPYAMRQEHFTIFLCRKPNGWTPQEIWPQLKNWN